MALTTARSGKWLLREPSAEAGSRLFCLPYSGCGASMYRNWPRFVGEMEICPVQLPGRENRFREKPFSSMGALARSVSVALLPYLDRPFAFFGHCSSALAGYETVLHMARAGYPQPARLYVSSQVAPHQGPHGRFLELSPSELTAEVTGLLAGLGVPSRPDLVELTTEVLIGDVTAHRNYGAVEPVRVACPITAIGWDADTEVPHELMGGWSDIGVCDFPLLSGPHYAFMEAPAGLTELLAGGPGPQGEEKTADGHTTGDEGAAGAPRSG
ncbi:thioesterase II family protein [Streptomyces albicerus]|uniref:thioesterase II family protein n=1 Tax=Streptomyces albicerus TaxID=2569859 RepID=UPI00124B5372|nr:thioesterase domain-containing protein [Streptomyces albicerus]